MTGTNPQVVSKIEDDGATRYILKNGTKLGNVLNFLPPGIVHKNITGIGATTLELKSPRNSIIVEPLKVTASSKAHKHTKLSGHQILYVGSETKLHRKKVTIQEIRDYSADPSIPFKKIIVVADSLRRVMDAIGLHAYTDYFFMIDEADSFQMDSTFRDSMEICLDYYKDFPEIKRALVSATYIGFSDPGLQEEHVTTFEYEILPRRDIHLIHSDNVRGTAYDTLCGLITGNPTQQVVVAYNHVAGCKGLADLLVKNTIVAPAEIKILCSDNSKDKVGGFYGTLNDTLLPVRVNFLTSAYFTGLDIEDQYHLISISNPVEPVSALSDHKLKQIAGRCRPGLLSEHIIYGSRDCDVSETVPVDIDRMVEAAEYEIESLKCIERNFQKSSLLHKQVSSIWESVVSETRHRGYSLVRINNAGKPTVSYFNLDACLENERVNLELYCNWEALKNRLETDENVVTFENLTSKTSVKTKYSAAPKAKRKAVKKAIRLLGGVTTNQEVRQLMDELGVEPLCKRIYTEFLSLHGYVDKAQLLNELKKGFMAKDTRAWNNFRMAADFATLPITHPIKINIQRNFNVGETFTLEELDLKFRTAFTHSGARLPSAQIPLKIINRFVGLKKIRGRKKGPKYEVLPTAPGDVIVSGHKPDSSIFSPGDYFRS